MKSNDDLVNLLKLKENWDSYGAAPISRNALDSAVQLLDAIRVMPRPCGGVSLELYAEPFELDIDIEADGTIGEVLLEDLRTLGEVSDES